jgi:hypothetical protein
MNGRSRDPAPKRHTPDLGRNRSPNRAVGITVKRRPSSRTAAAHQLDDMFAMVWTAGSAPEFDGPAVRRPTIRLSPGMFCGN